MVQTLLLCFVHGFKGDEETFFEFPDHLRKLVSETKPDVDVHTAVYPKYETRGDLAGCVETFREWLQDQVTDLETKAGTPSAILEPSVGVILIAHSMGGFVAADSLFSVLDNRPVSANPDVKLMFPLIHGVLAFDTPFNGLSRSMFAYGAFSQYQNISSVWNIFSSVSSFGAGASTSQVLTQASPAWRKWQAIAARSGTYGAIVAGGVAAYVNRAEIAQSLSKVNKENITQSWQKVNRENLTQGLTYVSRDSIGEGFAWMGSHLKFVGALMKQAQLKTRLERLSQLKGVGVMNLYTSLGENGYWSGGYFVPKRTFCAVPGPAEKETGAMFEEQANPKAANEIEAHCSMFKEDKNPQYDEMSARARDLVVQWIGNDPRKVVDDYKPNLEQRERSMSEAHLFDDDGKLQNKEIEVAEGTEEEELQLEAILSSTEMPQAADGGVDEEGLRLAAAVPLPLDEAEASTGRWKKLKNPFSYVSLPNVPSMPSMSRPNMPSVSMPRRPSIPTVSLPKMPSLRLRSRSVPFKEEPARDEEEIDATSIPLPQETNPEEVEEEAEQRIIRRTQSVDSGVEVNVYELAKEEETAKTT